MRIGTRSNLRSLARSTAVIRDLERKAPFPPSPFWFWSAPRWCSV